MKAFRWFSIGYCWKTWRIQTAIFDERFFIFRRNFRIYNRCWKTSKKKNYFSPTGLLQSSKCSTFLWWQRLNVCRLILSFAFPLMPITSISIIISEEMIDYQRKKISFERNISNFFKLLWTDIAEKWYDEYHLVLIHLLEASKSHEKNLHVHFEKKKEHFYWKPYKPSSLHARNLKRSSYIYIDERCHSF